jgi:hypothetical protein
MNVIAYSIRRLAGTLAICLVAGSWAYPAHAEDTSVSADVKGAAHAVGDAARQVGEDVKHAAKKVGPTARKVGHTVADTAKQAGKEVAHGAKKTGEELKHAAKSKPDT